MLCRQAEREFGSETGSALAETLTDVSDASSSHFDLTGHRRGIASAHGLTT